jgi:hypothetical protein
VRPQSVGGQAAGGAVPPHAAARRPRGQLSSYGWTALRVAGTGQRSERDAVQRRTTLARERLRPQARRSVEMGCERADPRGVCLKQPGGVGFGFGAREQQQ